MQEIDGFGHAFGNLGVRSTRNSDRMCTIRDALAYGVFCLSNLGLQGINSLSLCSLLIMYSHFLSFFFFFFFFTI